MACVSLGLSALFGLLAVGARTWIHRRRTGPLAHSARRRHQRMGRPPALALAFVAGPVAELAFEAAPLVDSGWLDGLGLALSLLGLTALLWSQSSMGDSLRIGVDPSEEQPS